MDSPKSIITHWQAQLLSDKELASRIGGTYKFVITGDEGGTWIFKCSEPVSVIKGEGDAECTISMSSEDFVEMANKRLNPQVGYMLGKITVEGDTFLALKLGELL